ncbi:hypothetical protein N658DRAFT_562031 [Parathielavia hyrcaniae]|uniref:MYND-type domain-containing protein n=1 Tax=Parathielavia hyrcaniae TaxID=113614 RepID=A0AAN6PX15_9PEZI|nr:hypothetical protein N658DRAFT_562031 [Parathielavia hyrcaniae]
MEAKVRSFNNLSRPETLPSRPGGLTNHWVFGVCHVDLVSPADRVLAVNPQSGFVIQAGPAQIFSLPTTIERAKATIPSLLDAFVNLSESTLAELPIPSFAPRTWSTLDPDMAQAIEHALKSHDVKPALCKVGVCTDEERNILEAARESCISRWAQEVGDIEPERDAVGLGDWTRCHGCRKSRECFFRPLHKCGECEAAWYHSGECQRKHLEHHKPMCVAPYDASTLDAQAYYSMKAPLNPLAVALMTALRLGKSPYGSGTTLALHRLIRTGQDTPANMQALFGPNFWCEESLKKQHEIVRLEYLLDPPPGSPWHVLHRFVDDPSIVRSPRPATETEQKKVDEAREMQALIRERLGPRIHPTPEDKQAILETFGPDRPAKEAIYALASSTMNQGWQTPN